jgi:Flp pilus assembly protein TadG
MKTVKFRTKQLPFAMRKLRAHSRGQIAVIFTLASVTLIGAMALGTDVALLYFNWMQLQKAADAAALAGANYLPTDTTDAVSQAETFIQKNGLSTSEYDTPTISNNDTQITVTAHRTVPYYFARLLGLTSAHVSVTAIAQAPYSPTTIGSGGTTTTSSGSGGGSSGTPVSVTDCGSSTGQFDVLPIVVNQSTANVYVNGGSYTLNRTGDTADSSGNGNGKGNGNGPWTDAPGNWGAISLCGNTNSGNSLRSSLADGFYGPISVGQTVSAVTGVKNGPIAQGLGDRINASADNPTTFSPTDPRAVIVPVVSGFSGCGGNTCTLTVTGFLAFYIDSVNGGAITGHFVTKEVLEASAGDPLAYGGGLSNGVRGDPILIK